MTSYRTSRLIALAVEMEQKLDQTMMIGDGGNYNQQFQAQREMLTRFYDFFHRHLRQAMSQMESDIGILKVRGFDPNMRRLFIEVYKQMEEIYKHTSETKPYLAAQEFVDYVGDRHHRSIIDNLEFLAKHHLETTKPQTMAPLPKSMRHIVEVESPKMIKELAEKLKQHMEQFPLIAAFTPTPIPPRPEPAVEHPTQPAGEGEKTNPAIPAKVRALGSP
jgi:hypothetical protein